MNLLGANAMYKSIGAASKSAIANAHNVVEQQFLFPLNIIPQDLKNIARVQHAKGLPSGSTTGMFLKPRAFMIPQASSS